MVICQSLGSYSGFIVLYKFNVWHSLPIVQKYIVYQLYKNQKNLSYIETDVVSFRSRQKSGDSIFISVASNQQSTHIQP
jgi:hypothetical protein